MGKNTTVRIKCPVCLMSVKISVGVSYSTDGTVGSLTVIGSGPHACEVFPVIGS